MNILLNYKTTILIFILAFSGCSGSRLRIGNSVTLCCPGSYENYDEYRVELVDVPIFLRDYVVDEFDRAFQELGLDRNDQSSDLVVTIAYEHVNLNPEQQDINPFVRPESITEELNYIAVIDISMRETTTGNQVWGGTISRMHFVTPGEYMHEDRARAAFLYTFRDLLNNYPIMD
ncbi:MAG TPA: hypothetical protein QGF41_06410 [Gammaproteobacteria bacterium]|nr:hypothetical protein [Gammaproteobacteria bacterium]|tara:strand:- start:19299 stop:19823 length:525 start_codon:yes stop_codon:yes gene_type:complete